MDFMLSLFSNSAIFNALAVQKSTSCLNIITLLYLKKS